MPASIRSRLLTLVLVWMIPALIAAAAMIWITALAERDTQERRLADSVRTMSLVLDRELARRTAIAGAMASSPLLDGLPDITPDDAALFAARAREAMAGLPGWVEVSVTRRVVLDSREQPGTPLAQADAPVALVDALVVRPLAGGGPSPPHASVVMPVVRGGRTVANIAVTLVSAEMQRLLDEQHLPREEGTVEGAPGQDGALRSLRGAAHRPGNLGGGLDRCKGPSLSRQWMAIRRTRAGHSVAG